MTKITTMINKVANITLLTFLLWVSIYNLIGKPDSWYLIVFSVESLFMGLSFLFLHLGVNVKKWLIITCMSYLFFRVLFILFCFSFPKIGHDLDSSLWFMRSIAGVILLIILIFRNK